MTHPVRTLVVAVVFVVGVVGLGSLVAVSSFTSSAYGDGHDETALVELGRRLFFDPAISRSGTNACASCHDPDHGWSSSKDHDDDDFTLNNRHTQSLVDVADRVGKLHWDGQYAMVEQLVQKRLSNPSSAVPQYGHPDLVLPGLTDADRPPVRPPTVPAPAPDKPAAPTTPTTQGAPPPPPPTDGNPKPPPVPAPEGPPIPDPPPPHGVAERAWNGYWTDPRLGQPPQHLAAFRDESGRRRLLDLQRMIPVVDRIERDGRYAYAFEAAFGSRAVTMGRVCMALGGFARTIHSTESPYDRFVAGDAQAISASAQRGVDLFRGEAGCARCHLLTSAPGARAPLTDNRFHVTGIAARSFGGAAGIASDEQVRDLVDPGMARNSRSPADLRSFHTPTLRDVARRGPWMHDGSMTRLEDVVRHYSLGAVPDPHLDPLLKRFAISHQGIRDIVAFLESLSGDVRPGIAPDLKTRAKTIRVRLLDARGTPLVGVSVDAVPAGDRLPGDVPMLSPERHLVTDGDGAIEFEPPRRTHTRLILPDGLRIPQGEWIPDTCTHVDLVIPVRGRAALLVTVDKPEDLVERLLAVIPALPEEALYASPGPDGLLPLPAAVTLNPRRIFFVRKGIAPVRKGTVARYEAWVPVGAPDGVLLAIPAGESRAPRPVSLVPGKETRIDLRAP